VSNLLRHLKVSPYADVNSWAWKLCALEIGRVSTLQTMWQHPAYASQLDMSVKPSIFPSSAVNHSHDPLTSSHQMTPHSTIHQFCNLRHTDYSPSLPPPIFPPFHAIRSPSKPSTRNNSSTRNLRMSLTYRSSISPTQQQREHYRIRRRTSSESMLER